ncbi:MAG TPA: DMT family transporter [Vicinamibacterales bacterium]|nr:DMT family transporter [Vicinamibacterales bacterium]
MPARDLFDLVLLGALWGASFLFMRVAAPEFGPVPLIAARVAIATVVLVGLVLWRGSHRALWPVAMPLLILGAINTAVPFSLLAYAALTLPAGLSSALNASVPLFGAVIGFLWLGVRPTPVRVLGLLVGFAGVLVLAWPRLATGSDWRAIVAALSATVLYGLAAYVSQRTLAGVPPLVAAAGSQMAALMLLAPLAIPLWPETPPSTQGWASALILGVGCTAAAYVLYFRLIARAGPSTAMAVTYLIPVFGVTWGALLLHERLGVGALTGGMLVLAGVALATWTPRVAPALR